MNIHFIGTCGVSMSELRHLSEREGFYTSGSDLSLFGHSECYIKDADMVVYSSAVDESNVELCAARKKGIPIYTRAEFLAFISKKYMNVLAVSGSHGKTTATAMLSKVFESKNPTTHIGGDWDKRVGGREFFITEACEYKRSFLSLAPDVGIVLNAELDHTDYYKDFGDYLSAFSCFAFNCGKLIVLGDDPNLRFLHKNCTTFGFEKHNDIYADDIEFCGNGFNFCVYRYGEKLGKIMLPLYGRHNILNALSAVSVGLKYNIPFSHIAVSLSEFKPVKRRFELLGMLNGASVFSDYAHHPTELITTIKSAYQTGAKRVVIIFEPHTFSRTKSLLDEFAGALSLADDILLMPIYPAREDPIEGVTSHLIADNLLLHGKQATVFDNFSDCFDFLKTNIKNGTAIVFTGAGTIDNYARKFMQE